MVYTHHNVAPAEKLCRARAYTVGPQHKIVKPLGSKDQKIAISIRLEWGSNHPGMKGVPLSAWPESRLAPAMRAACAKSVAAEGRLQLRGKGLPSGRPFARWLQAD